MMRKILITLAGLLVLVIVALGIFLLGGPEFPPQTDTLIAEAIQAGPPELVTGKTGYAQSGGVKIWYEQVQPPGTEHAQARAAVLLIMGAGSSSLFWPPDFIQALAQAGYQVIRFDNRGTGMSDWMDRKEDRPYTLEDMAADALAVLDAAGVRQAHVIGTSMGGMIAQRLAISHGERVLSLVSMSTSGYLLDPELASLRNNFQLDMFRLAMKYAVTGTEAGMIKMMMGVIDLMVSDGLQTQDARDVSGLVLYEMRKRRGLNPHAMAQHFAAMQASGSRLEELGGIKCPVLVIHGTADAALNIAHARKYAARIPAARTLWLEGAGHIVRDRHMPEMMAAIFELLKS